MPSRLVHTVERWCLLTDLLLAHVRLIAERPDTREDDRQVALALYRNLKGTRKTAETWRARMREREQRGTT